MKRYPGRPRIDRRGLKNELTNEQRMKIKDQWVKYAKSGNKNLENAYLEFANLWRTDLEYANLRGADLTQANLEGANLTGANFIGAKLYEASLSGAHLERMTFIWGNVEGADLTGADLRGANLYGANLLGANLTGANLIGARLRGANNLEAAILPNYFKLLRTVGLTDLSQIKVENSDLDMALTRMRGMSSDFFELRKFFRDRGQDAFGEFLELEIRAEMDQVKRELGLE